MTIWLPISHRKIVRNKPTWRFVELFVFDFAKKLRFRRDLRPRHGATSTSARSFCRANMRLILHAASSTLNRVS